MRCNFIKDKLLIIPGYLIGLCCLILLTYRTLIAFFSDTKSIVININNFGEQYYDLIALVIIWVVFMIGFIYLIKISRKEKKPISLNYKPTKNKIGFLGYFSNSSKDDEKKN